MMDNVPTGAMTVRGAARRLNVDEKTAYRSARLAVCPPAGQGGQAQRARPRGRRRMGVQAPGPRRVSRPAEKHRRAPSG